MKKTVQVNIGGIAFFVDEDAFEALNAYLDHLNRYYASTDEGPEVVADIEARIAELLQEQIDPSTQSVSRTTIEKVIEVLGQPEQFDHDPAEYAHTTNTSHKPWRHRRRIFRDTDRQYIGGVCSGLAAYAGVHPNAVRVAFLLAFTFYGTSLLIYMIMWIIVPEARTRSEKLEMQGEPIDIASIERSIRDEFANLKKNVGI